MQKPGRNDPCSCGSGKKFKKCCGAGPEREMAAPLSRDTRPVRLHDELTPAETARMSALVSQRDFATAERELARIVKERGACAQAWSLLGLVHWMQGRDAVVAFERVVGLRPDDAEAHGNLGKALRRAGRAHDAAQAHRRAIALQPDHAESHNNLGTVLVELGDVDDAVASFRRAVSLQPELALAHANLARVLHETGQPAAAIEHGRRALSLDPALQPCEQVLADALFELGALEEARAHYERLLDREPVNPRLRVSLAALFRQAGQHDASRAACRRALELEPRLVTGLVLAAQLDADEGDRSAAEHALKRALELEPASVEALVGLANLRRMTLEDRPWLEAASDLSRAPLPTRRAMRLEYALGKYHDDLSDYDTAFAHYARANALAKSQSGALDRSALRDAVEQTLAFYDLERLQALGRRGRDAELPVFVVGMPRSGTTLVEQILASHPAVHGAGEIDFWAPTAAREAGALSAGTIDVGAVADQYLASIERSAAAAGAGQAAAAGSARTQIERAVDKMPLNFGVLGLIHGALPRARVIHVRRDPLDTCLSIFFHPLPMSHAYANDLADLAYFYSSYARLMDHWRRLLPATTLLEVDYEDLVAEPEREIRRMLDFLGLPWHAGCLEFHRTPRRVSTFSQWQVREPLRHSSIGRSRHYRHHLGPLQAVAAT
jgi:Tfp pilus assembly protein PilF